jgi:hypothetical protein
MKMKSIFLMLLFGLTFCGNAQENTPDNRNLSIGADFTSSYVWRGLTQGTSPAIQPWGEFSFKGLSLGAWGSYEFSGQFKEVDLIAKYTHKDFSLSFTDFFFPDFKGLDQNFFNFKNETTGHAAELALSFNGSESIPFSVYGGS